MTESIRFWHHQFRLPDTLHQRLSIPFFLSHSFPPSSAAARTRAIPMRPLPASPATLAIDAPREPSTPPQGYDTEPSYAGKFSDAISPDKATFTHKGMGYTYTQPLPLFEDMHPFLGGSTAIPPKQHGPLLVSHLWAPNYISENWVYTDGSDIDGHSRLGASVVHIPTATTIYIDATVTEKTRTIMRAELVAIHTHGPRHIRSARMDWSCYRLLIQPTCHQTPQYQPRY